MNPNSKAFPEAIGNVKLAKELFGENQEITWLQDTEAQYSRMTLTRDGKISWKDEDKWDHDAFYFCGSYSLIGSKEKFTVIGRGDSSAYLDWYKKTESSHHDKNVIKNFESSSFTGKGFTVICK